MQVELRVSCSRFVWGESAAWRFVCRCGFCQALADSSENRTEKDEAQASPRANEEWWWPWNRAGEWKLCLVSLKRACSSSYPLHSSGNTVENGLLWALADKWLWQWSLPWISAWALTAGTGCVCKRSLLLVKVTPTCRGEITAAVSQGGPEPRVWHERSGLAFFKQFARRGIPFWNFLYWWCDVPCWFICSVYSGLSQQRLTNLCKS